MSSQLEYHKRRLFTIAQEEYTWRQYLIQMMVAESGLVIRLGVSKQSLMDYLQDKRMEDLI